MSNSAVRQHGDSPSDSADSAKLKQASRSVSLLTPEQLQRKRAQDRESQRQTRARVKQTISDMERKLEQLTQELHLTRLENASLLQKNSLPAPGTIRVAAPPPPELQPIPEPEFFPEGAAAIMDVVVRQKGQMPQQYSGAGSHFQDSMLIAGPISTESSGQTGIVDPSLLYLFDDFQQQPLPIQVWQARPVNYPATCKFDQIMFNLIENLKPLSQAGGTTLEFSNSSFPSVAALVNPQQHAMMYPLSSAIASKIIYVFTMDSLPEQIACMWNICSVLRWMVTCSQEDYFAMPEWMRPTASQLVTSHPIWVDFFPWPKCRERVCRNAHYHNFHEDFKNTANETFSINWPYKSEDTVIQISATEFAINPVFLTHLRNYDNWTVGHAFLEKYPDFEGEVNIGAPRKYGARH